LSVKRVVSIFCFFVFSAGFLSAQSTSDPKQQVKQIRDLAKSGGQDAVTKIAPYLNDPNIDVRIEAVKQIVNIGGQYTLDPLIKALSDNDPEVQIRATDGLVNFYLPGYVKSGGLTSSIKRAGNSIKAKFTDTNDQIIDPYVQVRPDVIIALGKTARGGASMDARANAAQAIGVLRGKAALPDLLAAIQSSKDDDVIYESLIAMQKIRDPSVAPKITYLLKDFDDKVQITALETTGLLQNKEALPEVRDAFNRARNNKIKRAAMQAMAYMADESNRSLFTRYLTNSDENLRASAAEGIGRLKNPADRPRMEEGYNADKKMGPRLAFAFGEVEDGNLQMSEFAPLRYLVNTLNSAGYRGVALAYLIETARDQNVRHALYSDISTGTKDEKIGIAQILGRSGDRDSIPYLETLSKDPDPDIAQEGLRWLRSLRARLG